VKNYKRLDERLDLSIQTEGEENVRMMQFTAWFKILLLAGIRNKMDSVI
jgi:hypothetical protein